MPFVLDASVVLAWMLPDESSARAQEIVGRAAVEQVHAPSLLLLEVGNALLQAQRRSRLSASDRLALFQGFCALPIALDPLGAESTLRASELAERRGLSLYDGSYLDLCLSRRCAIATFDQRLASAARTEGVVVIGAD